MRKQRPLLVLLALAVLLGAVWMLRRSGRDEVDDVRPSIGNSSKPGQTTSSKPVAPEMFKGRRALQNASGDGRVEAAEDFNNRANKIGDDTYRQVMESLGPSGIKMLNAVSTAKTAKEQQEALLAVAKALNDPNFAKARQAIDQSYVKRRKLHDEAKKEFSSPAIEAELKKAADYKEIKPRKVQLPSARKP